MAYSNFKLNTSLLVISFYTNDGNYPKYAELLSEDCERLGIDYYIAEKQSFDDYCKNCNIKPFFIKEALEKFKKPVLWMDVDGSIVTSPSLFFEDNILSYDVAANRATWNADKIHVGSMWFNYTKPAVELINAWCESVSSGGIDDSEFNSIWNNNKNKLRFYELPQNYFTILKSPDSEIPADSCIVHRISNSFLKRKYKEKFK